jgi:hypothetical protein
MESRGNTDLLSAISSTLVYGPLPTLPRFLSGALTSKRTPFANDFHTYTLEWTPRWIRMSVDDRVKKVLELNTAKSSQSFWNRGKFPQVATNGSSDAEKIIVNDPWSDGGYNAPFDQGESRIGGVPFSFFLIPFVYRFLSRVGRGGRRHFWLVPGQHAQQAMV